jgi:glycosyltransferase involved in cell wall biosynthesis
VVLISVIVPVYNVENYLRKCIESIIFQRFKFFELILIDDGSTDSSGEICDEYSILDKRIRVIHTQNHGLSIARNNGIYNSKSELITFVDSDDWVSHDYLETLYHLKLSTKSDISCCNFQKVFDENVHSDPSDNTNSTVYYYSNTSAIKALYLQNTNHLVTSWGKLYDKKLFEHVKFPPHRFHEDEFTTPTLFIKSKKISYTTQKLLYYRQRFGSIMNSNFNQRKEYDYIDALIFRYNIIEENNLSDLIMLNNKKLFYVFYKLFFKYKINIFRKDFYYHNFFVSLKFRMNIDNHSYKFKILYKTFYRLPYLTLPYYYLADAFKPKAKI